MKKNSLSVIIVVSITHPLPSDACMPSALLNEACQHELRHIQQLPKVPCFGTTSKRWFQRDSC